MPPGGGRQGHRAAFAAARAVVYGFDLGPEVGYALLAEHWNPACQPPWSERELRHECEDADRVPFGKPRGYLRDAERDRGRGARASFGGRPAAGGGDDPPPDAGFPPPGDGEGWDDPYRLARLFTAARVADDGSATLLQWRDHFHEWGGACWRPVPDSDLNAALACHCRMVFEADYPVRVAQAQYAAEQERSEGPRKPVSLFKVTA